MIPPMNTPKTLLGMLTISLLLGAAGGAVAIGGSYGGIVEAQADADARYGVNYQPVLDGVDDGKEKAQATAEATLDQVTDAAADAAAQVKAQADAQKDSAVSVSYETKSSLLGDIGANLQAFGGWIQSIFVKPTVKSPSSAVESAHATKDLGVDMDPGYVGLDGKAHADIVKDLRSGADLDYDLPPPPMPKASFGAAMKMAVQEFFHLG